MRLNLRSLIEVAPIGRDAALLCLQSVAYATERTALRVAQQAKTVSQQAKDLAAHIDAIVCQFPNDTHTPINDKDAA